MVCVVSETAVVDVVEVLEGVVAKVGSPAVSRLYHCTSLSVTFHSSNLLLSIEDGNLCWCE